MEGTKVYIQFVFQNMITSRLQLKCYDIQEYYTYQSVSFLIYIFYTA